MKKTFLVSAIITPILFFIIQQAHAQPFELFPATNDAAPGMYTKTAPVFDENGQPWDFKQGKEVKATIDASKTIHLVTPYQFGCNAAWWNGKEWFIDPDRIAKAEQAGIKFWRWPGGSSSDNYYWNGNYSTHPKDSEGKDTAHMNQPWAVDTDEFIDFCRKTGSEAVFTVNYGAARDNSVKEAADLAAAWVKHCNIDMKFKVRYWEIGNEVYGPWEEGNKIDGKPDLTGDEYAKDFKTIANAMKNVDPDIYVGAVAVDVDNGEDWTGYRWWMRDMLPGAADTADFLVDHIYFGGWPYDKSQNYIPPANSAFFNDLPIDAEGKSSIDAMVAKYTKRGQPMPCALTEYNMKESPAQSIELINGLFISEVLGENIKAGFLAANLWDWKNGKEAVTGGDHGMLASSDPDTPESQPRPEYYAFALYYRAFGDKMVEAESEDPSVKVYASSFLGGGLGIVIVNENNENKTVDFNMSGYDPSGRAMGWVLTGKDLNSKLVSWNGVDGPGGGGPFPIDGILPYKLTFDPAVPLKLAVEARSATGVIIY